MARQVRFDPFGMQLAGEQAGLRDEAFLQDQTRRARASDYDFNTLAPLRLEGFQRDNRLGAAAEPYQMRQLGLNERMARAGLYRQEAPIYSDIGIRTGNMGPSIANDLSYQYGYSGLGLTPEQQQAQANYFYSQTLPGFTPDQIPGLQYNIGQQFGVPVDPNPILDPNLIPNANQNYLDFGLQQQANEYNNMVLEYQQLQQRQEAAMMREEQNRRYYEYRQNQQGRGVPGQGVPGQGANTVYDPVDIFQ